MTNIPNYIYAVLARSFDNNLNNNNVHLISSVYYSKNLLDVGILERYSKRVSKVCYVLYIYNDIVSDSEDIELGLQFVEKLESSERCRNEYFYEVYLGISVLLQSLGGSSLNNSTEVIYQKDIIELIIGDVLSRSKDYNSILNNVLFVFIGLNWDIIKHIFKYCNIGLSGGTITKRNILSSVEYNLSTFLFMLGVKYKDVYESFSIYSGNKHKQLLLQDKFDDIKSEFQLKFDEYKLKTNKGLYISFLSNLYEMKIKKLSQDILNLKLSIDTREGNISSLKNTLKSKVEEITTKKSEFSNSKKVTKLQENIKNLNIILERDNLNLKTLKSQLELLKKKQVKFAENCLNLNLLELQLELQDVTENKRYLYETPLYKRYKNISEFDKKIRNNQFKNKREYSTLSTNREKVSNNSEISLVYKDLMEILYSSDDKQEVQLNIENYLLNQNNLLLSKNPKTSIDFNLLNKGLFDIFSKASVSLLKLYTNYKQEYINLNKNTNESKVLLNCDKEFLLNIMLGRVLRIISSPYSNNHFFTEVSFELGKDLLNHYNLNLYLKSKRSISYSS